MFCIVPNITLSLGHKLKVSAETEPEKLEPLSFRFHFRQFKTGL